MADCEFSILSKQAARFAIGVQPHSMVLLFALKHCLPLCWWCVRPPPSPPLMAWAKCLGIFGCFRRKQRLNTNTITLKMSKTPKFVALAKWYSKPNAFIISMNTLKIKLNSDDIIFSRPWQSTRYRTKLRLTKKQELKPRTAKKDWMKLTPKSDFFFFYSVYFMWTLFFYSFIFGWEWQCLSYY